MTLTAADVQELIEAIREINGEVAGLRDDLEDEKNTRRWFMAVAIVVGVLVITVGVWQQVSHNNQREEDAAATMARRTADCLSLGAIAEANITGANTIVRSPQAQSAYAQGMRDAYGQIKAGKGYSVDCLVIGPPPTTTTQPGG